MSSLGVSLLQGGVSVYQTESKLEVNLTLMNVGENTALGDGYMSQKLVEFLVISDGELEMARDDTCLLVITGCVSGQLKDFSS